MPQLGTGLRISEALRLQVGDVDFLRGTLRVERQRDSRQPGFIPPKTRSSVRTVPLGRVVVDELAAISRPTAPPPTVRSSPTSSAGR